jgi:S1-C subfamily serine protease
MGNPLGFDARVSTGVISALGRVSLRQGDLIAGVNEQPVRSVDNLYRFLSGWPPGWNCR